MELQAFELVLLRRPPTPPVLDEAALEQNQREHLAYYAKLRADGTVLTNGPLLDQPDESLRALVFFRTGSLETARQLAEQDPAVQAGRFTVEDGASPSPTTRRAWTRRGMVMDGGYRSVRMRVGGRPDV